LALHSLHIYNNNNNNKYMSWLFYLMGSPTNFEC
jgi:hypothetical protein